MTTLSPFTSLRRFFDMAIPATIFAATASGCIPTFAPPVRAVQYGAPGRVHAGDVEIGGTLVGFVTPIGGSAHVGFGISDAVSLEAGATFIAVPKVSPPLLMGWVGPRFTLPRGSSDEPSLLLDGELGLGAGIGGELCRSNDPEVSSVCDYDGRRWYNRAAFGGYQGAAIGVGYKWFSLYGRGRIEESVATGIPVTIWRSAMLGFGFDVAPRVSIDVGAGYVGYSNAESFANGWFYQAGVTVRFGRRDRPSPDPR